MAGLILAAIGWRQTQVERDKAVQARTGEEAQRKTAQSNALAALEQSRRAKKGESNALRLVYRSNMILAGQAWEQYNVGSVRELLEKTEASPSRGFEWYYWQRQTHLELKTFRGHQETVLSVAFSPDGQRIVTGSRDRTAKVWEAATGKELLTFKGHRNHVTSVALSSDGERVVTACADHTAKVWETATGEELLTLNGHRQSVTSVAFSPDSQWIVSGSWDGTAKVWEAATAKQVAAWQAEERATRDKP